MSHSDANKDRKHSHFYNLYKKGDRARAMNLDKCYKNFQYYSNKYNYRTSWQRRPPRRLPRRQPEKERPQSPSSFSGTEEYALKKIQETSEVIKRRLMMPENDDVANKPSSSVVNTQTESDEECKSESDKNSVRMNNKKNVSYNVGEIHDKIMTHLTKLSHSKKMNLIYAKSSGYDGVIQQIHKQKRLELSKALRNMCSNQTAANSEIINSIIPDIGIKIEDLPLEMIQELSSTLDWNFEDCSLLQNCEETVNVNPDVCDNFTVTGPSVSDGRTSFVEENGINSFSSNRVKPTNITAEFEVLVQNDSASNSFLKNENNCNFGASLCENLRDDPVYMETDNIVNNIKQETFDVEFTEAVPDDDISSDDFIEDKGGVERCKIKEEPFNIKLEKGEIVSRSYCNVNGFLEDFENVTPTDKDLKTSLDHQNHRNLTNKTVSKECQTYVTSVNSLGVQTIINTPESGQFSIDKEKIYNLDDAIDAMLKIDTEIMRLTNLRQSIFSEIQKNNTKTTGKNESEKVKKSEAICPKENSVKKTQINNEVGSQKNGKMGPSAKKKSIHLYYKEAISLEKISEKVVLMKLIDESLLAATEAGNIHFINIQDGTTSNVINLSQSPITAIEYWVTSKNKKHLLVGSLDTKMYELNFETKEQIRVTKVKHSVQCLDIKWNCVFIGTTTGSLLRYSLKRTKIEFEDNISPHSIMVLKAAQEGARHVLLVATRNAPVCIRDARSCLILRIMTEFVTPTVYSLILEKNMVYCGTTLHDLLVYSFHDGNLVHRFEATNSKGICCMKVVKNLLFASCYDGNVYVYNVKHHKFVGTIPGPGGVILAMEVVNNIVVVGTISLNLKSILIPEFILQQNKI